jgi:hypothetical protein
LESWLAKDKLAQQLLDVLKPNLLSKMECAYLVNIQSNYIIEFGNHCGGA